MTKYKHFSSDTSTNSVFKVKFRLLESGIDISSLIDTVPLSVRFAEHRFWCSEVQLTVDVSRQVVHHRSGLTRLNVEHQLSEDKTPLCYDLVFLHRNVSSFDHFISDPHPEEQVDTRPLKKQNKTKKHVSHLLVFVVVVHVLNGCLEVFNVELEKQREKEEQVHCYCWTLNVHYNHNNSI